MMSGTSMSGIIIILVCLLSTAISASIDKTSDPDGIWHNVHRRTLFGSAGESSVTGPSPRAVSSAAPPSYGYYYYGYYSPAPYQYYGSPPPYSYFSSPPNPPSPSPFPKPPSPAPSPSPESPPAPACPAYKGVCLSCPPVSQGGGDGPCEICTPGYYLVKSACFQCQGKTPFEITLPAQCATCTGSKCLSCQPGFKLSADGLLCT